MDGYKPGAECSLCQGRCCRERGCSLSPEDMWQALKRKPQFFALEKLEDRNQLKEELVQLLKQPDGLYALDFFSEKSGPCFYLRMRHKCYTFIGVDAIGECVAWTKSGCSLDEKQRPKGGRYLESKQDGACVQHYTREQMCEDWAPYAELLKEIWDAYYTQFQQDGTFDRCDNDYFEWIRKAK